MLIYVLIDPFTNEKKYIGCTSQNPSNRLRVHLYQSRHAERPNKKEQWIRDLLSKKARPKVELLENVPDDSWEKHEQEWIAKAKQLGWPLTNSSIGGKCGALGVRWTDEQKQRLEYRINPRIYKRGWKWTEQQHIERAALMTEEFRARLGHKGENHSKAKLTEKDVLEIRQRYKNGELAKDIALDFPASSYGNIRSIVAGVSWRHLF